MKTDHIPSSKTESLPWYRYGMVWLVIMLPVSVVVASMFTIALALKHAPVLVNKPLVEDTEPFEGNALPAPRTARETASAGEGF